MTADMLQHTRDVLAARHRLACEQYSRWHREESLAKRHGDKGRQRLAERWKVRNEGVAGELERVAFELGFDLRREDQT